MKWSHLPNAGGIYDQDPMLIAQFRFIFSARAEEQEKQQKKREQEQQRNNRNVGRVAGRR